MANVQVENRPVERLIRIGEVKRLTGLSTATLYRKICRRVPTSCAIRSGRTSVATVRGSKLDRRTDRTAGRRQ